MPTSFIINQRSVSIEAPQVKTHGRVKRLQGELEGDLIGQKDEVSHNLVSDSLFAWR